MHPIQQESQFNFNIILESLTHHSLSHWLCLLRKLRSRSHSKFIVCIGGFLFSKGQFNKYDVGIGLIELVHGQWLQKIVHARIIQCDFEMSKHLSNLVNRKSTSVGHRVQFSKSIAEKVNCIVLHKVSLHLFVEVLGLLSQRLSLRIKRRA